MRRWLFGVVLVVVALGGREAIHADYEEGQRAWEAGRHSEALREWQAAANAGDAVLGASVRAGVGGPAELRARASVVQPGGKPG